MSAEENKALVRQQGEMLDKADWSTIRNLFTSDFVYHYPGNPPIDMTYEEWEQMAQTFRTTFPDLSHTIEDIIAEGDKVVARCTLRGTHKGEFMGIAPTDKQVMFTVIGIHRISNGRFVEVWVEFDALGLMQQLGAVPPLGEGS